MNINRLKFYPGFTCEATHYYAPPPNGQSSYIKNPPFVDFYRSWHGVWYYWEYDKWRFEKRPTRLDSLVEINKEKTIEQKLMEAF